MSKRLKVMIAGSQIKHKTGSISSTTLIIWYFEAFLKVGYCRINRGIFRIIPLTESCEILGSFFKPVIGNITHRRLTRFSYKEYINNPTECTTRGREYVVYFITFRCQRFKRFFSLRNLILEYTEFNFSFR